VWAIEVVKSLNNPTVTNGGVHHPQDGDNAGDNNEIESGKHGEVTNKTGWIYIFKGGLSNCYVSKYLVSFRALSAVEVGDHQLVITHRHFSSVQS
jgi:hypothetical protein